MQRRGRNERARSVYKKAFEESFVNNFKVWQDTLLDVNESIEAVSAACGKKCSCYTYDEFCKLVKKVIDERSDAVDWDSFIAHGKRSQNAAAAIERRMAALETEILFACFEQAMLHSLGPRLYKRFKLEIEQHSEGQIIL